MNQLHGKLLLFQIIVRFYDNVKNVPRGEIPKDRFSTDSILCTKKRLPEHILQGLLNFSFHVLFQARNQLCRFASSLLLNLWDFL